MATPGDCLRSHKAWCPPEVVNSPHFSDEGALTSAPEGDNVNRGGLGGGEGAIAGNQAAAFNDWLFFCYTEVNVDSPLVSSWTWEEIRLLGQSGLFLL